MHDFDLYDLQDEKKQWNDSPVTKSIFLSFFLNGSEISSERLEEATNGESVLKCWNADKHF